MFIGAALDYSCGANWKLNLQKNITTYEHCSGGKLEHLMSCFIYSCLRGLLTVNILSFQPKDCCQLRRHALATVNIPNFISSIFQPNDTNVYSLLYSFNWPLAAFTLKLWIRAESFNSLKEFLDLLTYTISLSLHTLKCSHFSPLICSSISSAGRLTFWRIQSITSLQILRVLRYRTL